MNRLILTFTGGMPFEQDDLDFMQQAYQEAFRGMISALGGDNFGATSFANGYIISGINFRSVGLNFVWDAGFIALNGEVCAVDAGSIANTFVTVPGVTEYHWDIISIVDPTGTETYQDASVNDTYILRKATVQFGSVGADFLQASIANPVDTYADKVAQVTAEAMAAEFLTNTNLDTGWVSLSLNAGFSALTGNGEPSPAVRRFADGMVRLRGRVTGATAGTIATLPVGFRPDSTRAFRCIQASTPDGGSGYELLIQANGDIVQGVFAATTSDIDMVQFPQN